ncbi:hypothetical protein BJX99DRAFT_253391 [Aspergillus californicus]
MSALRAALRMQRLNPSNNFLAKRPDEVIGHELDWLALHIGEEDSRREAEATKGPQYLWKITGGYRSTLAELTKSISPKTGSVTRARNFEVRMVQGRLEAQQLWSAMEATINLSYSKTSVKTKWNNADGFGQSVQLQAAQESQICSESCTLDLKIERDPEGPWELPKASASDLEAVLGLWAWSLKRDPIVEVQDPQSGLIRSKAG